jgi:hypothetical protein
MGYPVVAASRAILFAVAVNLDHPAHYIRWGWIQISVANFIVILLMFAVFLLAIFLRFPGTRREKP